MAREPRAGTRAPRRKERKNIASGVAHVVASFNNTIVTIVLLKEARTWATPEEIFFRSFLRGRAPAFG